MNPGTARRATRGKGDWREWRAAFADVVVAALVGAIAIAGTTIGAAAGADTDALDELTGAVMRFRGVGDHDVTAYTARFTLPDEGDEAIVLLEAWRAPAELALGAADDSVPRAIVRSWALFLEPMFVARTSLLGMELDDGADRLRQVATIRAQARASDGTVIDVDLPEDDASLPELLRDVARLHAEIDARGRIDRMDVDLRVGTTGSPEQIRLTCTYDPEDGDLPHLAEWAFADDRVVRVETTFRFQGERRVPHERLIVFPSRWDPGEKEEILIRYGEYDFAASRTEERFAGPGLLHFDANGLISEPAGP